jgi:hypothetical protein
VKNDFLPKLANQIERKMKEDEIQTTAVANNGLHFEPISSNEENTTEDRNRPLDVSFHLLYEFPARDDTLFRRVRVTGWALNFVCLQFELSFFDGILTNLF